MKDRLALVILIIILWVFLVFLNIYVPFIPSTLFIIAFIIAYCFILALAQLYQRYKDSKGKKERLVKEYKPFVNIFVPAHNEAVVLKDTIKSLVEIDYPYFDIMIIDDRSEDNTLEIAKELSIQYPEKVKYHSRSSEDFPGKSAVLNDAFNITSGDVICVFDADAKVNTDFLTRILPYLSEDNVAAVQARKVISNKDLNVLTKCQHFEYCMDANVQLGRDSLKAAVELRGNGELIKRVALDVINGWNNYTLTDDLDISTKLHLTNYDIRFCPDVIVYEEAITSVKSIIKQRKRWAEGSIRRYIDYFDEIVASNNISRVAALDMVAYFSEFVLPIWLISDLAIQIILPQSSFMQNFMTNIAVMTAIAIFFITMLFSSIRKFEKYGIFDTLKWSIITALYLILLWTIVVAEVVFKIIFKSKDMNWYKAQRVGVVGEVK